MATLWVDSPSTLQRNQQGPLQTGFSAIEAQTFRELPFTNAFRDSKI